MQVTSNQIPNVSYELDIAKVADSLGLDQARLLAYVYSNAESKKRYEIEDIVPRLSKWVNQRKKALQPKGCSASLSLHHDFANIIRKFNRILKGQSFDQEGLIVQQSRVQIQLLFIFIKSILQ